MFKHLIATVLAVFALNSFAAVDANRASQAELETVKGIGPGLSTKIMDARKTGEFKNWDDLVDRVGGVGPKNATRFSQAGLTVAGAAYDSSANAPAEKARKADKAPKAEGSEKAAKPAKAGKAEKAEKAPA